MQPARDGAWRLHDPTTAMLSTREAAARLGLAEHSVRRAIARGDLDAIKLGRSYSIYPDDLERFAQRLKRPGAAESQGRIVAIPAPAPAPVLPVPATRFVGREAELDALAALLEVPTERVITVTGPGGIGKTRLALAAAAMARDRFPDGVYFVDLTAVTRPQMVVPAVAQGLGLREQASRDRHAQLAVYLRGKHVLLLLDNFEQVLDAGSDVARIVAHAPETSVLVTSRASLRIGGERVLPVPPLSLPEDRADVAALLASDAGHLFVERARERDPAFAVDDESAPLIADICARLDGLPLAIELAAARTKLLSPRLLLERLSAALPLLIGGTRDAPQRQRTLRDTIAWSYELLAADEQALFRRLSVFAGGFTLEAADWMAAASPDALDRLSSLLDQNLLIREFGPLGEPRFRLLETVREFGREQLAALGEEALARADHARHFLGLAQSLRVPVMLATAAEPMARLEAEHANFRAALTWLDETGHVGDFVRLAAALEGYWYGVGHFREGRGWLERALTHAAAAPALDRALVMIGLSRVAAFQEDHAIAESLAAAGIPLLREVAEPLDTAAALNWRANMAFNAGDYATAESLVEEELALAETVADPRWRAAVTGNALNILGVVARCRGDFALAAQRHQDALDLHREHGHDLGVARSLTDLGDSARDQGDYPRAIESYRAVLTLVGEQGEMRVVADALAGVACAAAGSGDMRRAARLFGAVEALRTREGISVLVPADRAAEQRGMAIVRQALGDERVDQLLAEGRALTRAEAEAEVAAVAADAVPEGAASSPARGVHPELTRRETQVLSRLVQGQTDREIAEALFLSPRTVNWHVRSILAKFGVASRREAIARARADGLFSP